MSNLLVRLKRIEKNKKNARLILKWENAVRQHPQEVENFLTRGAITWERHWPWFKARDNRYYYFICIVNGGREKRVGTVSLEPDKKPDTYASSILIAGAWRNKGIGAKALHLACKRLKARHPEAKIVAKILSHNIASIRCFEKAHFRKIKEEKFKKKKLLLFRYYPVY